MIQRFLDEHRFRGKQIDIQTGGSQTKGPVMAFGKESGRPALLG